MLTADERGRGEAEGVSPRAAGDQFDFSAALPGPKSSVSEYCAKISSKRKRRVCCSGGSPATKASKLAGAGALCGSVQTRDVGTRRGHAEGQASSEIGTCGLWVSRSEVRSHPCRSS